MLLVVRESRQILVLCLHYVRSGITSGVADDGRPCKTDIVALGMRTMGNQYSRMLDTMPAT